MSRYLARKIVIYLMTFFVAVTIDWAIPRFMPGDPIQGLISRMQAEPTASEALTGYYTKAFGLDVRSGSSTSTSGRPSSTATSGRASRTSRAGRRAS